MRQKQSQFRSSLAVRRTRPKSLSDPFNDHSERHTQALLSKQDSQLDWRDFQCILGPFLPAGTYSEGVYFLPLAFEYIVSHDDDALDLVTSIFWFVSEYADDLERDGLLDGARGRMVECLEIWTSRFSVIHFDRPACRKKGWGLAHFDYVKNVEAVCEGTCDLVRFARHADLAISFYESLHGNTRQPVAAAWFLELARACSDVYHPPDVPAIRALLADREALERAALLADSIAAGEESPTYWSDTLAALAISA